jgi:four helix bundle protein
MDPKSQELLDRTFAFGVAVLKLLMTLPSNEVFRVAKYQLAKASTSIGANYEEAQAAESKEDFIHKVGISLKEVRESHYWLRVLRALTLESGKQKALDEFISEAAEFKSIFSSIRISAKKNLRKK